VIQASDAAGAKRLRALIDTAHASIRKEIPPDIAQQMEGILAMAIPEVVGDTLTLDIDQAKMDKLSKPLVTALTAAREQAMRMKSMSNMRQILQANYMYADEHGGTLPTKIPDDITKYLVGEDKPDIAKSLLTNPANPGKFPGYVYVRAAEKFAQVKDPGERVILYEAHDQWPVRGIAVGFVDGHVQWVASEAEFKQMLEKK